MTRKDKEEWLLIFVIIFVVIGFIGWSLNILAILNSNFNDITGLLVLRLIGVFLAPLGAVIGWF